MTVTDGYRPAPARPRWSWLRAALGAGAAASVLWMLSGMQVRPQRPATPAILIG